MEATKQLNMNKKYIIALLILLVIIIAGYFIFSNYQQDKSVIYTNNEFKVSFSVPLGWFAKPMPSSSSTIFLSPKDFEFPGIWEGPLTPIIIGMNHDGTLDDEANQALRLSEPDLKAEYTKSKGYNALSIKGVPVSDGYFSGRYYESFSIQRGTDIIDITYFGNNPDPKYKTEFDFIVQSLNL